MLFNLFLVCAVPGVANAGTIPIQKRNAPSAIVQPLFLQSAAGIDKRHVTANLLYGDEDLLYTTFSLGSKKKQTTVAFDTGTSFTWFISDTTVLEETSRETCQQKGFFDWHSLDSSFTDLKEEGEESYQDDSAAHWNWGTDSVWIDGKEAGRLTFGVANKCTGTTHSGLLGAGPEQSQYHRPTMLMGMFQGGKIPSPTLSLYIDGNDGGKAIFGGIDTTKFAGVLQPFDLSKEEIAKKKPQWVIHIDEMPFIAPDESEPLITQPLITQPLPARVDSGASRHYFPEDLADSIAAQFEGFVKMEVDRGTSPDTQEVGIEADPDVWHMYQVDCGYRKLKAPFKLRFKELTIEQPLSDFIFVGPNGKCYLDIVGRRNKSDGTERDTVLGVSFFRHAYVVFDNEHNRIYIAKKAECVRSKIENIDYGRKAMLTQGEC